MKIVEIIFFLLSSVWTEELSRFIKHFEPLQYDPITVEHQHALVRKSHHLGRVDFLGGPNFRSKFFELVGSAQTQIVSCSSSTFAWRLEKNLKKNDFKTNFF